MVPGGSLGAGDTIPRRGLPRLLGSREQEGHEDEEEEVAGDDDEEDRPPPALEQGAEGGWGWLLLDGSASALQALLKNLDELRSVLPLGSVVEPEEDEDAEDDGDGDEQPQPADQHRPERRALRAGELRPARRFIDFWAGELRPAGLLVAGDGWLALLVALLAEAHLHAAAEG